MISRRTSILVGLLFVIGAQAAPKAPLEESVWIRDPDLRFYPRVSPQKNFVIDHRKSTGFELYGPQGLKKWLSEQGIPFVESRGVEKTLADSYPSFKELKARLLELEAQFPNILKVFSIGNSVQGRELLFAKISRNPSIDAQLPEFKYISSMHGDEITGRELMMALISDLLLSYGKDTEITELINHTEIFIMPSMNPDGSEMRQRWNANRYDLNRDFPDFTSDPQNTIMGRQIETQHIMKFQEERNFALSANFHGGAEVVNYPWDTTGDSHPLLSLIQSLSLSYSKLATYIYESNYFDQGITNGFDWYEVDGGMQDWSEYWYNDLQFTVELSDMKWPPYSQIPQYYRDNRNALIRFIKNIHQGAGFVTGDLNDRGSVSISKDSKLIGEYTYRRGEFYRVLEPGTYEFAVRSQNGKSYKFQRRVTEGSIVESGNYEMLSLTSLAP